ncbi:MAG: DNA mismatch repair endonuclease MutL [Thermodesulfobacteriota bacterium]
MSKIRVLSEHLANQIAAGEVVERPASVVKELVENSLDGGATRIAVQVEGSGITLIRVADNGEGMDPDDVLLAIERHATSKLSEESSLDAIATLGFRGEALPSIGSVSRLTILSRPAGRETGSRADIRYGTLHAVHEAGCAPGTVVEVRALFGNVPARKKFLKSSRTELGHIEEVIRNLSLSRPDAAFSLEADGRTVVELPIRTDFARRVRDVFAGAELWLEIDAAAEETAVRGYLLQPDYATARTSRLRILVNGRPVQDRVIRHAVVEGLQGFLMKGQSPAGALLLTIPAGEVDVNVHPAKQEIRFRAPQEVHRLLVRAVTGGLRRYQDRVREDIFTVAREEPALPEDVAPAARPAVQAPARSDQPTPRPMPLPARPLFREERSAEPAPVFASRPSTTSSLSASLSVPPATISSEPVRQADHGFAGLRLIGQALDLYLLCEREGQLVVIDQHAAHERLLYQELRNGYLQRHVPRQSLMFPVTLELRPGQAEALLENGGELERLGFGLEHFGDETWLVKSVPAMTSRIEPRELLLEILDGLAEGSGRESTGSIPGRIDHLLATMACKAAIKAGNRLEPREMLGLLARMGESDLFSHCPHGRPVLRSFSEREIAHWFQRG